MKLDGDAYRPETLFHLFSLKAGFESSMELSFTVLDNSKTLLFVGGQRALVFSGQIKETGGDIANMTLDPKTYERVQGYIGIRVEKSIWYADGRINYFIKGRDNDSRFAVTWRDYRNYKTDIEGAKNDPLSFTLTAGLEKEFEKDIFFYAGVEGEISANLHEQSLLGKAGIRYIFPMRKNAPFYKDFLKEAKKEYRENRFERERLRIQAEEQRRIAEEQKLIAEQEKQEQQELLIKEALEKHKELKEEDLVEAQERREKEVESYKFDTGFFETGSARLQTAAIENIRKAAAAIKETNFKMITVEGHTDSVGNDDMNMRLSERRARSVCDELIRNGIPEEKIRAMAFGESMPVADNNTVEGRAANRRVEIFIE